MTEAVFRVRTWFSQKIILIIGLLVLLYLFLPVGVVMLMSFNAQKARNSYSFDGFTLDNWKWSSLSGYPGLLDSVKTSLEIAGLATLLATILGALMAFAMVRHRFAGRSAANIVIFLPMATPEIVMGSSLLALFINAGFAGQLGFKTILIAHIMFCLSFVVVTVKARLSSLDPRLEEAARDLYANEFQTFTRVTFPLVFPGILAAALLSFSLSIDDYIITSLNSGAQTVTFPMFVWGVIRIEIPMQINVIGTVMFLAALLLVVASTVLGRMRERRS
jgi:spermidine/putrescine transport system permease protein